MTDYDDAGEDYGHINLRALHIVANGGSTYAKVYNGATEVDRGDYTDVLERVLEGLGVTITRDRDDMSLPDDRPTYDTSLDPISPTFDLASWGDRAWSQLREAHAEVEEGRWWHVNVYERGREYGGPEEGGWWFDTGRYDETRSFMVLGTQASAWDRARDEDARLSDLADAQRTPELGSTQYRGGRYTVRAEVHAGHDFPVERPCYS